MSITDQKDTAVEANAFEYSCGDVVGVLGATLVPQQPEDGQQSDNGVGCAAHHSDHSILSADNTD